MFTQALITKCVLVLAYKQLPHCVGNKHLRTVDLLSWSKYTGGTKVSNYKFVCQSR